tara:strand:- start:278 stop:439 length:162 start_codon:yes stop_codon:yes gene_type:complete
MFFGVRMNSTNYVHIIPGRLKKNLKLSKENKKRILKQITNDQKLIYAFFLDIA